MAKSERERKEESLCESEARDITIPKFPEGPELLLLAPLRFLPSDSVWVVCTYVYIPVG
jgi:hypothetical protein